jgi:hypothetical protein
VPISSSSRRYSIKIHDYMGESMELDYWESLWLGLWDNQKKKDPPTWIIKEMQILTSQYTKPLVA